MATLSLADYLGGPDAVTEFQVFPSTQKSVVLNFGKDITGWTFTADYQTLVIDEVAYKRDDTLNLSESVVIGYFPKGDITDLVPTITNAALGTVTVTFPAGLYTGPLLPKARTHAPVTIYSLTYTDTSTPAQTNSERFALVQSWEPGVTIADPVLDVNYTAVGA